MYLVVPIYKLIHWCYELAGEISQDISVGDFLLIYFDKFIINIDAVESVAAKRT